MIFLLKPSFIIFFYIFQGFSFKPSCFERISQQFPSHVVWPETTPPRCRSTSAVPRSAQKQYPRRGQGVSGWLLDDLEHTDYLPVTRLVARLVRKGQNLTQSDVCQAVSWDIWVWVDSSQHWCLPPEILGSRIVGVYLGYMPNRN